MRSPDAAYLPLDRVMEALDTLIAELAPELEPERDYRVIVNAQVAALEALRESLLSEAVTV